MRARESLAHVAMLSTTSTTANNYKQWVKISQNVQNMAAEYVYTG
jgi:hypothetical protein